MKFKLGDRVRAIGEVCGLNLKGKCGTVILVGDTLESTEVGVEFDEPITNGHSCAGNGKMGHCRNGVEGEFELIRRCDSKIVITSDGFETLARLYVGNKVIKSSVAKCHPHDVFEFMTGAMVAFERLITPTEEEPKRFEGKAVCIKSNVLHLIIGKIYDFSENDGRGKAGGFPILRNPQPSIEEINRCFGGRCEFLEIKE